MFQSKDSGDTARTIDVVITWVDDSTPGYRDMLKLYAKSVPDLDPSRTRDNLEILRFGLRALERHAPWINHIYLFTCRPQVPAWLKVTHPRIRIVHHDEVIPAEFLPTFNSFAIVSHLHLIPGLSDTFLYLEDDMLLLRDVTLSDFLAEDGRPFVFEKPGQTPRRDTINNPKTERPWNLALAEANQLLDQTFGTRTRGQVNHVPLLIQKATWQAMIERFPEAFETTRRSRFRAPGNVALEYLYPQFMLADGQAVRASRDNHRKSCGYVPLEDFWPVTALALWTIARRKPKWVTLNDNFGNRPNSTTENMARSFLERVCPQPSSFERA